MPNKFIALIVAKILLIAIGIGIVISIYGCNTVEGIGKDLQQAGRSIQEEAAKR